MILKFNKVKIKRIFHFLFMLSILLSCNSKKEPDSQIKLINGDHVSFSEMDEFLSVQMDSFGMPGLSIAIINDAEIIYYRTFGVTNVDTKEAVSEKTLFDAGSLSKTPFAFLAMKMVEQGIFNLDQPLYTYLPYPDIAYDERYKLITARMVLSHTSGFPNWRFFNEDNRLDIKFMPGTQYQYSGEGFEYLANVAAHLKNMQKNDLQDLFTKEVSNSLELSNFYYTWNSYVAENQAAGHVDGKVASGYGINAENPGFYAAYSLQTEAKSYASFLIAIIEEKDLKEGTYKEMLKPQVLIPSESDSIWYCLGVEMKHSEFGNQYEHGGDNYNFTSSFMINKKQKSGYVFFTNCNKGFDFNKKLEAFFIGEKV